VTNDFDRFAPDYKGLLRDPIREAFAGDPEFFVTRKADVLSAFAAARGLDRRRATWLDVGCGTGELLRAAGGAFGRAIGCDVSAGMLEGGTGLEVVQQQDAARLPFESSTADWVTAVCVYHHVDDEVRPRLTADVRRVLKPGGIFVVIEHNPLNPAVQLIVRRTPVDADARLLTAGRTRRLLEAAGLDVLETRYFLLLPRRVYRRFSAVEHALSRTPLGGQYAVFARRPPDY